MGEMPPRCILFAPFLYEERAIGVVELGSFTEFTPAQTQFLEKALENIGIAFMTAQARARVNELYAKRASSPKVAGAGRRIAFHQRRT